MNSQRELPRILVIDDLYGRTLKGRPHKDREAFCRNFRIVDVTGDSVASDSWVRFRGEPVAEAFFCRGQLPACAKVGDEVENDIEGTLSLIRSGWNHKPAGSPPWALIVLDMCFYTGCVTEESEASRGLGPGMPEGRRADSDPRKYFGLQILKAIQEGIDEGLPVTILSSMDSDEIEREWVHGGAVRFIKRNADNAAEQLHETLREVGMVPDASGNIKGKSLAILKAIREARNLGNREHVLFFGETGTGKERFADFIHSNAKALNPKRPYEVVDLQNIPQDFIATELFGYTKNAPVHADGEFRGAFQRADGGDLFLDEIGCVPKEIQARLLRAVQFGKIRPLGSKSEIDVDVRVIAATDRDPDKALIPQLRARLHHSGLEIPPLRERVDDIPELTNYFLEFLKEEGKFDDDKEVEPETLTTLQAYDWPKNVRDLFRVIRSAVSAVKGKRTRLLATNHLPAEIVDFKGNHGEDKKPAKIEKTDDSESVPTRIDIEREDDSPKTDSFGHSNVSGDLSDLQRAILIYLNEYVERSRDESQPIGKQLSGTRAYRLMLPDLERSKAKNPTIKGASLFKKLVGIHPQTTKSSLGDYPALSEIWEWIETRGGARKKKKATSKREAGGK